MSLGGCFRFAMFYTNVNVPPNDINANVPPNEGNADFQRWAEEVNGTTTGS